MMLKPFACAAALLCFAWSAPSHAETRGVAVVELFTSQGCSSCPPADRVLAELDAEARRTGQPVFILSYHVDYWNRLGWTDPFSSAEASQRQREYAHLFRSNRIYTPQMIVNGVNPFVGSDERLARRAVSHALQAHAKTEVTLGSPVIQGQTVSVTVRLPDPLGDNHRLMVALTQHGLGNDVPRGENRGRHLTHAGVVRAFANHTATAGEQTVDLTLPDPIDADYRVVAFVQSVKTGQIHGATMRPVPAPEDG